LRVKPPTKPAGTPSTTPSSQRAFSRRFSIPNSTSNRFTPDGAFRRTIDLLAWALTLPCTMLLAGGLFLLGRLLVK